MMNQKQGPHIKRLPPCLENIDATSHSVTFRMCVARSRGRAFTIARSGTHDFPALEFLARWLAHVPDAHEVLVRHYGAYSVRRRARWRRAGILTDARPPGEISPVSSDPVPDGPALRARRQRWAELLQRIFEVDPLRCPRCGGLMQIIAFILDPNVIHALLRHLRRTSRDPRALPEHDALFASRAPP